MKKILNIAVDVQEYYFGQEYSHDFGYTDMVAKRIDNFARRPQVTNLWILYSISLSELVKDFRLIEIRSDANIHCLATSPGSRIYSGMHPRMRDYVANKTGKSAFNNHLVDPFIREHGFDEVVVTGAYTEDCASKTFFAGSQSMPDIPFVFLTDLTCNYRPELHDAHIARINRVICELGLNGRVMESGQYLAELAVFEAASKEKPASPAKATPVSELRDIRL